MKKILSLFLFLFALHIFNISGQNLSNGGMHMHIRCPDSTAMGAGSNSGGQVGNGSSTNEDTVQQVSLSGITCVGDGHYHSLFVKSDGTAWSCGWNGYGCLGDGTLANRSTPVQVVSLTGVKYADGGYRHSVFLKNDSTVWACGQNNYGQLGDGTFTNRSIPVRVVSLTGIVAIAVGFYHTVFLKSDGTVWTVGHSGGGELGDTAVTNNRNVPYKIPNFTGIVAIAAYGTTSIAIKGNGTVWGWGGNIDGQLGVGHYSNVYYPVPITALSGIIAADGGSYHSVFLKNDGTVLTCGLNNAGQLGNGSFGGSSSIPVTIPNFNGVVAVAGGGNECSFIKNDGTVWAVGDNGFGQLGDGTSASKSSPVQVINLCPLPCSAPVGQSTNITFTNVTSNSITVNWTNGNGTRRIVRIKTTNSFTAPANGTDYVANPTYLGGEQTVYNGTGNSVTVTGLASHHIYWFRVYEASCSASSSIYLTSSASGNPRQKMTLPSSQQSPNRPELNSSEEDNALFEIFPSPNNGRFKVVTSLLDSKLEIFNILGERIYSLILNETEKDIELKNAAAGIYFVKIFDGEKTITQKLIIQ